MTYELTIKILNEQFIENENLFNSAFERNDIDAMDNHLRRMIDLDKKIKDIEQKKNLN